MKLTSVLLAVSLIACVADETTEPEPLAEHTSDVSAAPQIVFLNYGGGTFTDCDHCSLSASDRSWIVGDWFMRDSVYARPAFTTAAGQQRRASILAYLRGVFGPYNVQFVEQRPASGNYTMAVMTPDDLAPHSTISGYSPVDCGNQVRSDIVFLWRVERAEQYPLNIEKHIAHELGHSFGLEHVLGNSSDLMLQEGRDIATGFSVSALKADELPSNCAPGATTQNGPARLLANLGPRPVAVVAEAWQSGVHAVGRNADGRLELFRRRADNSVWQTWQLPGGGWAPWIFTNGYGNGELACATNADGRLEVFLRGGDGAIWHRWQTSPGGAWTGWTTMGGWHGEKFAVGRNAGGHLEVFSRDVTWALQHSWQGSPGGSWNAWQKLSFKMIWEPIVGANQDGRLEVFARATEGNGVFHLWQQYPNGTWNDFQPLQAAHAISGGLSVARNADGRLEVFGRGFDAGLYHIWQLAPGGQWIANWVGLGGVLRDNAVAVIGNLNGTLEAFVIGSGGSMFHKWQTAPGGAWGAYLGWAGAVRDPVVARNADGRLEVFVRADYGDITCRRWQHTPAGAWSDYLCWQ
ncbi:MAG: hypothetical protein WKG01_17785 [Kofleriaceae bacterium]